MKRSLFSRASGAVNSSCGSARCFCDSWGINRTSCSNARALWQRHQSGTYLYTAIFAAALTVDAREKSRRTQQWDDALAQVNEEAELLKAANSEREKKLKNRGRYVEAESTNDGGAVQSIEEAEMLKAAVKEGQRKTKGRGRFIEAFVDHRLIPNPLSTHCENRDSTTALECALEDLHGSVQQWTPLSSVPLTLDSVQKFDLDKPARRSLKAVFRSEFTSTINAGKVRSPENWLPPQSIAAGGAVRHRVRDRRLWTQKKINIMELSVARLVLGILDCTTITEADLGVMAEARPDFERLQPWIKAKLSLQNAVKPHWWLDLLHQQEIAANLGKWENDSRPEWPMKMPSYRNDTYRELKPWRESLNNSLQQSFQQWEAANQRPGDAATSSHHFTLLCLEVCIALIQSRAAPDITTYNILLIGLLESQYILPQVKQRMLSRLDSFRNSTQLRPNEITCATTLKAFREAKDWIGLSEYVALMRGEGRGLMLANPNIKITRASQGRLRERFKQNGRRIVVQAVLPNPILLVEMIKGVLDFAGFAEAYRLLDELKPEGWLPDWYCLETLLFDCLRRQDWTGGQLIWKEIQSLSESLPTIPNQIYSAFLALCHLCEQKVEFHTTLRQAKQNASQDSILAQIRGILKIIRAVPETVVNVSWRETVETAIVEANLSTQPRQVKTDEDTGQEAILKRVHHMDMSLRVETTNAKNTLRRVHEDTDWNGDTPKLPTSETATVGIEDPVDGSRSSGRTETATTRPSPNVMAYDAHSTRLRDVTVTHKPPESKSTHLTAERHRPLDDSQDIVKRVPIWRTHKSPVLDARHDRWMDDNEIQHVELAAHG